MSNIYCPECDASLVVKQTNQPSSDDSDADGLTARARAVARTPRASALAFAQSVPLPPSPSVVADAIDRRTAVIRRRVSRAYEDSGVIETAQVARESLSSVVSVEALIIAFEAYCLRYELLADRYAFTVPMSKIYGKQTILCRSPTCSCCSRAPSGALRLCGLSRALLFRCLRLISSI